MDKKLNQKIDQKTDESNEKIDELVQKPRQEIESITREIKTKERSTIHRYVPTKSIKIQRVASPKFGTSAANRSKKVVKANFAELRLYKESEETDRFPKEVSSKGWKRSCNCDLCSYLD
ncbi:hypothetical protein HELRODRAFT_172820 [Helobdella robusta]|uniref:Uncharacterized protein n=1 Tax=Helobdella robusta TaxID=6412 RepID=T1F5Z1_HELRO|nr:hypothetical protein HELRODRAFT_172820 [Helobdella robusta]ESO04428.1 hypothetical protein HELRODRAFT_172820 [Helobdella robusta]